MFLCPLSDCCGYSHCSDCHRLYRSPVLSCLAQAPVLVAISLSSAPPLGVQIPMCFLRYPPSLGLCGLVSGLLTLLLGVASYLAGFISSATVAACLPPPLSTHLVEDFMSALTVHESTHLLLRTFSVQQSLRCTCILIQHSFLREQSDQLWIQWESDFRFALLSYNREFCWVSMPPSSTPQRMRWTLSIPLADLLMRVDDL